MTYKKLMNLHEEATHRSLRNACKRHGAHVYTKVRCADVLAIENSGIADEYYGYALRAHFDFVVADEQTMPLFAVEYDGPTHDSDVQRARDEKKDWLADRFELPLLRINARYLGEKYRDLDMLTWFVEAWFAKRWYDSEQAAGRSAHDDMFSPIFMEWIPGFEKHFPLWISGPVIGRIRKRFFAGEIADMLPSEEMGQTSDGTYVGIAWLRLQNGKAVCSELAMREQRFPIWISEALRELLLVDLGKLMDAALAEPQLAPTQQQVDERRDTLRARVSRPIGGARFSSSNDRRV